MRRALNWASQQRNSSRSFLSQAMERIGSGEMSSEGEEVVNRKIARKHVSERARDPRAPARERRPWR